MTIKEIEEEALQKAAERLTPEFRDLALAAGWPSNIVFQISVEFFEGALYIDYPEELKEEVEDLEYGTPKSAPNAVIRPFMARYEDNIGDIFSSAFEGVTADLGAFN
jgi:hypothetical protein